MAKVSGRPMYPIFFDVNSVLVLSSSQLGIHIFIQEEFKDQKNQYGNKNDPAHKLCDIRIILRIDTQAVADKNETRDIESITDYVIDHKTSEWNTKQSAQKIRNYAGRAEKARQ